MMDRESTKLWMPLFLGILGCGDGGAPRTGVPWEDYGQTQIIGPGGDVTEVTRPSGDGCLRLGQEFAEDRCVKPQAQCEGAFDVLVSEDKVLDVLCYPAGETLSPVEVEAKAGVIAQNENNAVIVLPNDASRPLEADLSVDANNVVIYGHGPDVSVLNGDLHVDGNNAIVRGVRIAGDVTISLNNATLFHCVIEGDLVIEASNTTIAGCDVFGSVTVRGNNTRFVGNRLGVSLEDSGRNTFCEANFSAHDSNQDLRFQDSEIGEALLCE